MLKEESESLGHPLNLTSICIDFEMAMIKALKATFPDIKIKACRFHIAQAWWSRIQKLHLQGAYHENNERGKWLRLLFGFPALDESIITESFSEYKTGAPPEFDSLIHYLEKTYMRGNSLFPPSIWAAKVDNNEMPVTNNSVESWHGKFGDFFISPHPDLYTLVENIECANSLSIIKAYDESPGEISLTKHSLREMHQKLITQQISLEDYLIWGRCGENKEN